MYLCLWFRVEESRISPICRPRCVRLSPHYALPRLYGVNCACRRVSCLRHVSDLNFFLMVCTLQTKLTVDGLCYRSLENLRKTSLKINYSKTNCKFKARICLSSRTICKIKKTLDRRGFMYYICGRKLYIKSKQKNYD